MDKFKSIYLVVAIFIFSISSISSATAEEEINPEKIGKDVVTGIKKECTDYAGALSTAKVISYNRQGKDLSDDEFNDFFISTANQCIFVQNYLTLKMLSEVIDDKELKEKNDKSINNMLNKIIETF